MKYRTNREDFANATAWVARQLPNRPPTPIMAGILIKAEGDTLTLAGFDYETSTQVTVSAEIDTEGSIVVSGKLLADISKSLPSKPLDVSMDGNTLLIQCGNSRFTLPTMAVCDYPELPSSPPNSGWINAELYSQAIAQVSVAAGKDESLPALTGIRVEVSGNRIVLAATDRFRLAIRELEWTPGGYVADELSALIPAKAFADTAKSVSGIDDVALAIGDGAGLFGFIADGRSITTRLLDAEFPRFRQLIPAEHMTVAVVEVALLIGAVKRMAVVAERGAQVKFAFDGETVTLSAGADGGSGEESMPAVISGPGIEIAFNPVYFQESLGALDGDYVQLGFTKPGRPAIIQVSTGEVAEGDGPFPATPSSHVQLLMPVRMPDVIG